MIKTEKSKAGGFTLIELLVVISVIGVLASIILVGLNPARTKARDARRIADLRQIYSALQLYYNQNGSVPSCSNGGYPGGCDFILPGSPLPSADSTQDGIFVPFLSAYLETTSIRDPLNSFPYLYYYGGNAQYPAGSGNLYYFIIGTTVEGAVPSGGLPSPPGYEKSYLLGDRKN